MQPATRWFDESFAPILTFDERVAHQYRFDPPPGFPLASTYASIVHHLSGLNRHTPTYYLVPSAVDREDRILSLRKKRLHPEILACLLNSLVRVSRRDADTKCRVRIPKVSHKILSRSLTLKENRTPAFLDGASGQLFLCMRFPFNIFSAFNSPSGVLFIFPSRYLFAIGLPFHN